MTALIIRRAGRRQARAGAGPFLSALTAASFPAAFPEMRTKPPVTSAAVYLYSPWCSLRRRAFPAPRTAAAQAAGRNSPAGGAPGSLGPCAARTPARPPALRRSGTVPPGSVLAGSSGENRAQGDKGTRTQGHRDTRGQKGQRAQGDAGGYRDTRVQEYMGRRLKG